MIARKTAGQPFSDLCMLLLGSWNLPNRSDNHTYDFIFQWPESAGWCQV